MKTDFKSYNQIIEELSEEEFSVDNIFANLNIASTLITFCNPYTFKIAQDNKGYLKTLSFFNYVFSDGILLVKLCSLKGKKVKRYSFDGNSIALEIFKYCENQNLNICIIGGTEMENMNARDVLVNSYKFNKIINYSGYEKDKERLIDEIISNKIDVVIVGMGAPLQDNFLVDLSERDFKGVGFSCGGYISQISDSGLQYYPRIINTLNLRSFYRVFKEPKRLFKRYTIDYLPFYKFCVQSIFFGK